MAALSTPVRLGIDQRIDARGRNGWPQTPLPRDAAIDTTRAGRNGLPPKGWLSAFTLGPRRGIRLVFLVALAAVGFLGALIRYFVVGHWRI